MVYTLALLVFLLFASFAFIAWRERTHDRRLKEQAEFAERIVNRMAVQAEESRAQLSEQWTRIQHPEIYRPDIRGDENQVTPPSVFDDDFDRVGGTFERPSEQNGN